MVRKNPLSMISRLKPFCQSLSIQPRQLPLRHPNLKYDRTAYFSTTSACSSSPDPQIVSRSIKRSFNATEKARSRVIPYAILLCSFSITFYYLSQGSSLPFFKSDAIKRGTRPLRQHQYVTLPIISSNLSVSPSLSDSIGDARHKHLQVQLDPTQVDSLTEEQIRSIHPFLRIMSIYLKEPTLQIERAYTPLHDVFTGNPSRSIRSEGPSNPISNTLDLIIKRYEDGELSRYAHRLRPLSSGSLQVDEVHNLAHVRGPVETWSWKGNDLPAEIIMIVGGTGITPAYQLLTNVFGRPSKILPATSLSQVAPANLSSSLESTSTTDSAELESNQPSITLLYSTPTISSLLLLPELLSLRNRNPHKIKVGLWVENTSRDSSTSNTEIGNDSFVTFDSEAWSTSLKNFLGLRKPDYDAEDRSLRLRKGRIGEKELKEWVGTKDSKDKRKIILVCGPDGFNCIPSALISTPKSLSTRIMVSAICGPKASDGKSQGQIGGILKKLGWTEEDVWKL